MPAVFSGAPGSVVAISTGTAKAALVDIGGFRLDNVIITSFQVSERVSANFKLSLNRKLYVHPFGDEASQLAVSLRIFTNTCNGASNNAVKQFIDHYRNARLSPSNAVVTKMVVGGVVYNTYCLGMDLNVAQTGDQVSAAAKLSLIGWGTLS